MRVRRIYPAALVAAVAIAGTFVAKAYEWPARPVTIIVPFGAGGPTDAVARIVAEGMRGPLGQPVVIENVAGASGTIGVGRVARAAPDGCTVSMGSFATNVLNRGILRFSMT